MLSFLSKLAGTEMRYLLHLMLRGVIPISVLNEAAVRSFLKMSDDTVVGSKTQKTKLTEGKLKDSDSGNQVQIILDTAGIYQQTMRWFDEIDALCLRYQHLDLDMVSWERQVGFLHLLEHVIGIIGYGMSNEVGFIQQVVLGLLQHAQRTRERGSNALQQHSGGDDIGIDEQQDDAEDENESNDEVDEEAEHRSGGRDANEHNRTQLMKAFNQSGKVRTLCIERLAGK